MKYKNLLSCCFLVFFLFTLSRNLKAESVTIKATVPESEVVALNNEICLVCGDKINEDTKFMYAHEGKLYNLCSAACLEKFKNNPQEYIKENKPEPELKKESFLDYLFKKDTKNE